MTFISCIAEMIPCTKEFHQDDTNAGVSRRVRVNDNTPHGYRAVLGFGIIGISVREDIGEDGLETCMLGFTVALSRSSPIVPEILSEHSIQLP
jgi:hypothetical protein